MEWSLLWKKRLEVPSALLQHKCIIYECTSCAERCSAFQGPNELAILRAPSWLTKKIPISKQDFVRSNKALISSGSSECGAKYFWSVTHLCIALLLCIRTEQMQGGKGGERKKFQLVWPQCMCKWIYSGCIWGMTFSQMIKLLNRCLHIMIFAGKMLSSQCCWIKLSF